MRNPAITFQALAENVEIQVEAQTQMRLCTEILGFAHPDTKAARRTYNLAKREYVVLVKQHRRAWQAWRKSGRAERPA